LVLVALPVLALERGVVAFVAVAAEELASDVAVVAVQLAQERQQGAFAVSSAPD